MKVTLHDPADLPTLRERARSEANAKQRDRLRAVLLAAEGEEGAELEGDQIAGRLGRSPRFVDQWLARYRKGGLEAVKPGKAKGQKPKLPVEQHTAFKERILAGPTEADGGVCTLRGAQAKSILSREFGVEISLSGVYELMHRLNLSCLKPRPQHRKNDPKAMSDWLERAPLLPGSCRRSTPASRWSGGSRTRHASASRGR
jgi:transposase